MREWYSAAQLPGEPDQARDGHEGRPTRRARWHTAKGGE